MIFMQLELKSTALGQATAVNILLPEKQDSFKTLWLLHGRSDDQSAWMRYTSLERYATEQQLAVVMPNADRSWYTDTAYGKQYFTYITQELPEMLSKLFKGYSPAREDNWIMGLSMGGYGALKAALTYPEKYSFCASFSGALDITRKNLPCDLAEWRSIFGFDLESARELAGTQHDLLTLAGQTDAPPYIYMWCGMQDRQLYANEEFSARLTQLGIPHRYETSEGNHTWKYWDEQLKTVLTLIKNQELPLP